MQSTAQGSFLMEVAVDEPVAVSERRRSQRLNFFGPLRLRRAGEKEAFLLAVICALDMYTTLWWVLHGEATEANPFLAWTFNHSPLWFVAVKCLSCLPAIFLLTTLAQKRKTLTVFLLRFAIVAYIAVYVGNVR
jgi:hypothetical protein